MTQREEFERDAAERAAFHYAKCEGQKRRAARMRRDQEHRAKVRELGPATVDEVERDARAIRRGEEQLKGTLARIPNGADRQRAVQALLRLDFTRAEISRMLGVSRARVTQLIRANEDACPF